MTLKSYSDVHLEILTAAAQKIGASLDEFEGVSFGPKTHSGPMVISAEPGRDNLNSRLMVVQSIQQLKAIGGISDKHYETASDRHIAYPSDAPKTNFAQAIDRARSDDCALESLIHPDDHKIIAMAMHAYVNGNSAKVQQFEPVINALKFPSQILVTVGEDITVTAANPLIIGQASPYVQGGKAIFGTVTVEEGGYIQVLIPVSLETTQMIMK